jgi:hypothetical protein
LDFNQNEPVTLSVAEGCHGSATLTMTIYNRLIRYNAKDTRDPRKNMPELRQAIHMAEEVGNDVGPGQILQ